MSTLFRQARTWHRPMMLFAGLMTVMTVVALGGLLFDDRMLLAVPIWLKPFKFAVSIVAYCVTWAWLVTLLRSRQRLAHRVSTVIVVFLAVEYVIILGQAMRGRASHFNVATPLDSALFSVMGATIAALWVGTLVLTVLLLRAPIADQAARWSIRLGAIISLAGLALGGLMLGPTGTQLESMRTGTFTGVVGAHTVGVPDGGPGMPIAGWSTIGGDLRIPHFVGMHALQALPLLAALLGVLATRVPRLRHDAVRARLVLTAGLGYAGLVGLVTWQALRGQPLTAPDGWTLAAFGALVIAMAAGTVLSLRSVVSQPRLDRQLVGAP
ncbi:hypothetical protein ABZ863_14825 [Saccharomonospora sp. NPDC046836]|uniref:hypothetical protein n=1 Tax=Saccharomonospora sp. NPDC046836 TaxID=3156921 RepID=UPI0033D2D04E